MRITTDQAFEYSCTHCTGIGVSPLCITLVIGPDAKTPLWNLIQGNHPIIGVSPANDSHQSRFLL
jgi:hypothetical protein